MFIKSFFGPKIFSDPKFYFNWSLTLKTKSCLKCCHYLWNCITNLIKPVWCCRCFQVPRFSAKVLEVSDDLLAVKNPLIHDNKGKVVMSWMIFLFSRIIISSNSLCRESQSSTSYLYLCTNLLKELGLGKISNSPYLLIYNNLDSFSHLVGILVVTSLPAWYIGRVLVISICTKTWKGEVIFVLKQTDFVSWFKDLVTKMASAPSFLLKNVFGDPLDIYASEEG